MFKTILTPGQFYPAAMFMRLTGWMAALSDTTLPKSIKPTLSDNRIFQNLRVIQRKLVVPIPREKVEDVIENKKNSLNSENEKMVQWTIGPFQFFVPFHFAF